MKRLDQKVWNQTIMAESTLWETDKWFSAYRWLLRQLELIYIVRLGKPYTLPNIWVETLQGVTMG